MGKIFATCGHEVENISDLRCIRYREGEWIAYGSYCNKCAEEMKEWPEFIDEIKESGH